MHILNDASRRMFLRHAGAMSAVVGRAASPVALNLAAIGAAAAQTASDYKAIVCLFFYGGNDTFNMVLPTDMTSWNAYQATRNQGPDPIALRPVDALGDTTAALGSPARLGGVLPITPANAQGRTFALHPLMGTLQTMFNTDKRLAIVPNLGPLLSPTTKAQYAQASFPKPPRLFSHNDQTNTWQALGPEGATRGWGGRMGDLVASQNTKPVFTSISAAGNAVWLSGDTVQQYQVGTNGAVMLGVNASGQVYTSADVGAALQRIVTSVRSTHPFDGDVAAVARRSIDAEQSLRTALPPASDAAFGTAPVGNATYNATTDPKLRYVNPLSTAADPTLPANQVFNALAQQFQVVARMISAGISGATGAKRQVFFVSLGGFDTHDLQNRGQADLFARAAHALRYFDTALGALGAQGKVTTFTASDFGRTFTTNGDGTDHGWGAHHFVMGGAVKGGDLYGNFPALSVKNANNNNFDGSINQLGNGALLPESSVEQLGATLGRWFGLSDTQLADIFPKLANWDVSKRNLGFMT